MKRFSAHQTLDQVVDCIHDIDRRCKTKLAGVEHGLVNIKLEFAERALRRTKKKLTEELLLAWLIREILFENGREVAWEQTYPSGDRKKCDLVIRLRGYPKSDLFVKVCF